MGAAQEQRIIDSLEAENSLLVAWIDRTLEPSMAMINLDILVREMETDIHEHIAKKGKSAASQKSLDRVNKILDLVEKLNVTVNQNNTYHLIAKHASVKVYNLEVENWKLRKELDAIKKAYDAE